MRFEINWAWNFVPQKPQIMFDYYRLARCSNINNYFKEYNLAYYRITKTYRELYYGITNIGTSMKEMHEIETQYSIHLFLYNR